jgi:hypothetical protein
MKSNKGLFICILALLFAVFSPAADTLEEGFRNPPLEAQTRCWWWWLNSNVTREAITRDLKAMKAKGMGGGLIFDADGSGQRGNNRVPAGPLFGSPAWRDLLVHACDDAEALGLELGLSIQSGWNLGGPGVTPEEAAKQLTWSEVILNSDTAEAPVKLPVPEHRDGFYRDIGVLAFETEKREQLFTVAASSAQKNHPPERITDASSDTFWVSDNTETGDGPDPENPEWLEIRFDEAVTVTGLELTPRKNYGPASGILQAGDGKSGFENIDAFRRDPGETMRMDFDPVTAEIFRLLITGAYDPRFPDKPRNVQIAGLTLFGEEGEAIPDTDRRRGIFQLEYKAGYHEIGGSAPDCRHLLKSKPVVKGEEDCRLADIRNLTQHLDAGGRLDWKPPAGTWCILRIGYTVSGAKVSTSSGAWQGRVADYMSEAIFRRYWDRNVVPILEAAGDHTGATLKYLQTDSWECGGMNWSADFREEFMSRRGYDPLPWLPVVCGKIVGDRDRCNRFLADLRKTIGDCVAENHYATFAELAAEYNMGTQPESGGPHAGPMDGIRNLSYNAMPMSEFWVYSPHRPRPENRFFVKQAASAAHIYGKRRVGAESFTSIGPHWDDIVWSSLRPSFDHEACAGLNLAFLHTFTCSPPEMGLPGQEYFAGTHFNPQVTWWDMSDGFFDYMNRCHFLLQEGGFVADVCYYYGDHVPNIAGRKEADPARVLPGYDYDVIDEPTLTGRLAVEDGILTLPSGMRYRLLVLPDHRILSLAALEAVRDLVDKGAVVAGLKPERTASLTGYPESEDRFREIADALWGEDPEPGTAHAFGKGRVYPEREGRAVLKQMDVEPDFSYSAYEDAAIHYIHRRTEDADIYFLSNQSDFDTLCLGSFRVSGKMPEVWDAVTGEIIEEAVAAAEAGRTLVHLFLEPFGSRFVVFRRPLEEPLPAPSGLSAEACNYTMLSTVKTLKNPWKVYFDPEWGGPGEVRFDKLKSWPAHSDSGIRYYSGTAIYRTTLEVPEALAEENLYLAFNDLVQMARVFVNGRDLGVVWSKPFQIEITPAVKAGENTIDIHVANNWVNRIAGDAKLPPDEGYTRTNITKITAETPLQKSGLIGPVCLMREKQADGERE